MLLRHERDQVQEEFATALAGQQNPKALVQVVFTVEANQILLGIPLFMTAPELASSVIETCLMSRWSRNPALLDMLLDYLITSRGVGAFNGILMRVRQKIDPNPSVYDSTWLIGERPFFDRLDFRKGVKRLIEDNGRPILRVSAAPDSFGRTYSRYFLEHLEDRSPGTVHVLVADLSPGTGPSYQIIDLLETVGAQLGVQEAAPPRADSSYPMSAARWMLKHIMARPGRWLVVLDGFGQSGLSHEVRETIEAMAAMVPSGQYRTRVRLVLLDYPHELPRVSPADVLDEDIKPAAGLTLADLKPCLADWDADLKRQGMTGLTGGEVELDKLATAMLDQAPKAGKERLERLNAELSKLYAIK